MASNKENKTALEQALDQGDKLYPIVGIDKERIHSLPMWIDRAPKEDMRFDSNMRYTIHNDVLLFGCDPMTLNESKIIRCVIANVQKNHDGEEIPIYQVTIPQLAKQLHVAPKTLYNEIEAIANSLMERKLFVKDTSKKDHWEMYHWIGWIGYDKGVISLKMSDEIKYFFTDLKNNFTTFDNLDLLMGFRCRYSISLSEAFLAAIKRDVRKRADYENGRVVKLEYGIDNIRWITATQSKYKLLADLKKRVIAPAVEEINEKLEMHIDSYDVIKKGASKTGNHFIFFVSNRIRQAEMKHCAVEVTSFTEENDFNQDYVRDTFNAGNFPYNEDQIERIVQAYDSQSEFLEAYSIAKNNSKYSIASYMLKMAENKKTSQRKNIDCKQDTSWDTDEFKKEFESIVNYWNEVSIRIEIEYSDFDNEPFYNLKQVTHTDIRHRRNYFKLLSEGETFDSVKAAIDRAAVSSYFLRISGTFVFFINPKNYFDIAAGERDYDTEEANLWKMGRN